MELDGFKSDISCCINDISNEDHSYLVNKVNKLERINQNISRNFRINMKMNSINVNRIENITIKFINKNKINKVIIKKQPSNKKIFKNIKNLRNQIKKSISNIGNRNIQQLEKKVSIKFIY